MHKSSTRCKQVSSKPPPLGVGLLRLPIGSLQTPPSGYIPYSYRGLYTILAIPSGSRAAVWCMEDWINGLSATAGNTRVAQP